ncbi:DUF2793 domain-containing protein [Novosphingobium sp. 1949]|uniref:DUF2793 domain-containing protein n=1 Tax=Novosphingobium organovorum TaxID=2930092 RepID=A0ABT0BI41_9SPHN|nr:DUF2793 domain-containing protein [Novosphingobium organovorum]MCJ2184719.1 DUF2793 domain-containing protein [Novosphingobium organovorum]
MSDPVSFDSICPRFALPLLYQGQSQKEAFVNETLTRLDALLHCSVEGEASAPPLAPENGENWIVGEDASGDWAGYDGALACRQQDQWVFITPRAGVRVFDVSSAQERFFDESWKKADAVQEPNGGSVVDSEARAAVTQLVSVLQVLGILPGA